MRLESNIWKLNVLQACRWFMLIMPIIVLFYQQNGLSMQDIMVLQAIFSVVLVACEVPSGYFSDTLGRRTCLIIGSVLGTAGFGIYCVSHSFYGFLAAEIVLGIGQSFISGTDAALLYDTLLETEGEDRYIKHQGRLTACGNFSEALAGIMGGLVALVSLRMNFYIETAFMALSIPIACSIREPRIHRELKRRMRLREFLDIVKDTLHDPRLSRLIAHCSLILAATLTIVWFVQPFLKRAGIPLVFFGIIWTLLNGSVGLASLAAHRLSSRLGIRPSLLLPIVSVCTAYLLLGFGYSVWSIAFFVVLYMTRGFITPVFSNEINRLVSTDRRATVLSIRVLFTRLIFVVVGPLAGWITDVWSMGQALWMTGCFFAVAGMLTITALKRLSL